MTILFRAMRYSTGLRDKVTSVIVCFDSYVASGSTFDVHTRELVRAFMFVIEAWDMGIVVVPLTSMLRSGFVCSIRNASVFNSCTTAVNLPHYSHVTFPGTLT